MALLKWFKNKSDLSHGASNEGRFRGGLCERLRRSAEGLFAATTEQAAAVQEAIASMTQMRSMLGQTNEQVQTSLKLAEKTMSLGQNGAQNGEQMKFAMDGIVEANANLEKMREVFKTIQNRTRVIHDIVFKTQLLSLNASIEASRAGQFGKGFAVVAEEVGRLAQTSGKAAKEIDQLLMESQKRVLDVVDHLVSRVNQGMTVTEEVRKSFGEISMGIQQIEKSLVSVGDASREQILGIEQSTKALEQINSATDDTRRNAEEIFQLAKQVEAGFGAGASAPPSRGGTSNPTSSRDTSSFSIPPLGTTHSPNEAGGGDVLMLINNLADRGDSRRSGFEGQGTEDAGSLSADDPSFKSQT